MFSFATIGGILLIVGAFFTYKGDIYKSVITYTLADIVWIILGIKSGAIVGTIFIVIGVILGIFAWLKMNSGEFNKTLVP